MTNAAGLSNAPHKNVYSSIFPARQRRLELYAFRVWAHECQYWCRYAEEQRSDWRFRLNAQL